MSQRGSADAYRVGVNGRVRVLVVDDSASTRTMLREALSLDGGIDVVGEAGGAGEAITQAMTLGPDVILMDVRMPDGTGVDATRTIAAQRPTTKVVALTWSDDPNTVRDMLSAGAIGYVVKGGTIDELSAAIRSAHAGEPELDHRVRPAAVEDLRRLLEEERLRREQVERLAKAREEFVQVLSHELRTPLTVISGALKMLRQDDAHPDQKALLESAIRRSSEIEFMVEGLELVGSDPSAEPGQTARPDLAVEAAVERLGAKPDRVSAPHAMWEGVPQRYLERVVFELLSNAIKHGMAPVDLAVVTTSHEGKVSVMDRGGWTPPPDGFAAFYQEDMSVTRTKGGLGIGLFLASRLCEACNGTLNIRTDSGRTVAEARFRLREG